MLGERLNQLRKSKKMTQQQVADKLHISRGTYAQYEIDRRVPEYATLEKMADYFEVSIDYLVGRTNEKTSNINNTDNTEDKEKHPGEILREYIEQGLTNEQLRKRGDLYVAFLALNDAQAEEFLNFAREQIFKNLKRSTAAVSESEEP